MKNACLIINENISEILKGKDIANIKKNDELLMNF
jgi:hypothetical protein